MNISQIYIALSIVVLAVIALLVFLVGNGSTEKRLTPIAGLAFAFVIAGILFGDDRLIGYGLMGIGVILAVVDAIRRTKRR
jgi:hypothetical protein